MGSINSKEISLKALEAYTRDVGRGVARIDYDAMDAIGASSGAVIEIRGNRRTVAKCLPLYPSDEGRGMIRMDGLVRLNGGTEIGGMVTVKRVKYAVPADRIVVVPLEAIPPVEESFLTQVLEGIPITKGDTLMVPYFGGRLTLLVQEIVPSGDASVVTASVTHFLIKESPKPGEITISKVQDVDKLTVELKLIGNRLDIASDTIRTDLTVIVRYEKEEARLTSEIVMKRTPDGTYGPNLGDYQVKASQTLQTTKNKIIQAVAQLGQVTVRLGEISKAVMESL